MTNDYDDVIASYQRCEDSGGFIDTFYEIFFAKSPDIPPKFAHTDMEKQKQIVMASLLWILRLYKGDPIARREVEALAESHNRHGHNIAPELYELWLDALCESVAQCDPESTIELEEKWRRVMRPGISVYS